MAARRSLYESTTSYGQPIPESPARKQADINIHAYTGAWVLDQRRSIARKSTELTPKLIEMGVESRGDLKVMKDPTVLMAALGINYAEANSLVNDAMAIHQQLAAPLEATAPLEADDPTY